MTLLQIWKRDLQQLNKLKTQGDKLMSEIKQSALELIGGTPVLQLNNYSKAAGVENATILAKLEYLNPAGSVKDRIAKAMIEDAEEK